LDTLGETCGEIVGGGGCCFVPDPLLRTNAECEVAGCYAPSEHAINGKCQRHREEAQRGDSPR